MGNDPILNFNIGLDRVGIHIKKLADCKKK